MVLRFVRSLLPRWNTADSGPNGSGQTSVKLTLIDSPRLHWPEYFAASSAAHAGVGRNLCICSGDLHFHRLKNQCISFPALAPDQGGVRGVRICNDNPRYKCAPAGHCMVVRRMMLVKLLAVGSSPDRRTRLMFTPRPDFDPPSRVCRLTHAGRAPRHSRLAQASSALEACGAITQDRLGRRCLLLVDGAQVGCDLESPGREDRAECLVGVDRDGADRIGSVEYTVHRVHGQGCLRPADLCGGQENAKTARGAALSLAVLRVASAQVASAYPQSTVITGINWEHRLLSLDAVIPGTFGRSPGQPMLPLITAWGDGAVGCPGQGSIRRGGDQNRSRSDLVRVIAGAEKAAGGKIMALVAAGSNLHARLNLQDRSVGFPVWRSGDGGRTWAKPDAALPFLINSFVQFGKGNAGAPQGLRVRAGATLDRHQPAARGAREAAQSSAAYEYFSGTAAAPAWNTNRSAAKAVFSDPGGIQRPSLSYVPGIDRYVMAVAHSLVENPSSDRFGLLQVAKTCIGRGALLNATRAFLGMPGGHFSRHELSRESGRRTAAPRSGPYSPATTRATTGPAANIMTAST